MSVSNFSNSSILGYEKRVQATEPQDNWASFTSDGTTFTSGGYLYHLFTASGTLTVAKSGKLEVLLVGGGGGAAGKEAGGGGAGQVLNQVITIPAGVWSVAVGAGGPATAKTRGGDTLIGTSILDNLCVAYGGAAGWESYGGAAQFSGACGAGGSIYESGGQPLFNDTFYGRTGGNGLYVQGAGGGAGYANNGNNGTSIGGAGGNGTTAYSAWGIVTSTGQNVAGTVYYAGGGGGGRYVEGGSFGTFGAGGLGGGGSNSAGTANTGGGGSGSNAGGSGVAIVRIPI